VSISWTRLAWTAALLMGLASWAGIFVDGVYAKEAPSWAAQGVGQDVANLCVVLPAMLVSTFLASRGSLRAALVALGTLLYSVYSYLLYAFFVHFGPWFPVYVAALGFSFYATAGGVVHLLHHDVARRFDARVPARTAAGVLMTVGVVFTLLWLGEIVPALVAGRPPHSVEEARLPVNPVHVLDLALVLPGMLATSVLLWKGRSAARLFAVPLLVFTAAMGAAILAMAGVMYGRGIAVPAVLIIVVSAIVVISLATAAATLRHLRETSQGEG
jgi:hypothetical protein